MSFDMEEEDTSGYGSLRRCSPDESRRGPVLTANSNVKTVHFPTADDPETESFPEYEPEARGRGRSRPQNSEQKTLDMQNDFRDLFDSNSADEDPWITLVSTDNAPFTPKPPSSAQKASRGGSSAGTRPKMESIKGENREHMISRLILMRNIYSPLPKSEHEDPTKSSNPWIRELSTRYGRKLANIAVEKEQIKTEKAITASRAQTARPHSRSRSPGSRSGTPASAGAKRHPDIEWEHNTSTPVRPLSVGGSSPRPRADKRTGNNVGAEDSIITHVDSSEIAINNTDLLVDRPVGKVMSPYFAGERFLDAIPALPDYVHTGVKRPTSKGGDSRPTSRLGTGASAGTNTSISASRPGSSVRKASRSPSRHSPSPPRRPKSSASPARWPKSKSKSKSISSPYSTGNSGVPGKQGSAAKKTLATPPSAGQLSPPPSGSRRTRPPYSATTISITDYYEEITNPDAPSTQAPKFRSSSIDEASFLSEDRQRAADDALARDKEKETATRKDTTGLKLQTLSRFGAYFPGQSQSQSQSQAESPNSASSTPGSRGKSTKRFGFGRLSSPKREKPSPTYGSYGASTAAVSGVEPKPEPEPEPEPKPSSAFKQSPYRSADAEKIGLPAAKAVGKFIKGAKARGVSFISNFDQGGVETAEEKETRAVRLDQLKQVRIKQAERAQRADKLLANLLQSRDQQEVLAVKNRKMSNSAQHVEHVELAQAYTLMASGGVRSSLLERRYSGLVQRHDFHRALSEGVENVHAPPTEHHPVASPAEIFHHEVGLSDSDDAGDDADEASASTTMVAVAEKQQGCARQAGYVPTFAAGIREAETEWDEESDLPNAQAALPPKSLTSSMNQEPAVPEPGPKPVSVQVSIGRAQEPNSEPEPEAQSEPEKTREEPGSTSRFNFFKFPKW